MNGLDFYQNPNTLILGPFLGLFWDLKELNTALLNQHFLATEPSFFLETWLQSLNSHINTHQCCWTRWFARRPKRSERTLLGKKKQAMRFNHIFLVRFNNFKKKFSIYIYIYICLCVCVSVCVVWYITFFLVSKKWHLQINMYIQDPKTQCTFKKWLSFQNDVFTVNRNYKRKV